MDQERTADPNNIREMDVRTDLDEVKEIWLKEVKRAHPLICDKFWDSKLEAMKEETRHRAKDRYVYKEDQIIKGFITARKDSDATGYIYELYVDFQYQRQGIGGALLNTLKGENAKFPELKGKYSQLTLSVYAQNSKAIGFYNKHDFNLPKVRYCPDTGFPKLLMIWQSHKGGDSVSP